MAFSFSKNHDRKCHREKRVKHEEELKKLEARIAEAETKQKEAEQSLSGERQKYADEKKAAEEELAKRKAEHKERREKRHEEKKKRKEERKSKREEEDKKKKAQEEDNKKKHDDAADAAATAATTAATAATTSKDATDAKSAESSKDKTAEAPAKEGHEEEENPPVPVKMVIVGGGPAGFTALKQIISLDPDTDVIYISDEEQSPYDPSPLSKELLYQSELTLSSELRYRTPDGYVESIEYPGANIFNHPKSRVKLLSGRTAIDLDAGRHVITLDDGSQYKYEKCLLAPGLVPNQFDVALPKDSEANVTHLRRINDFKKLHQATLDPEVKHITVIGNDFTASEIVDGLVDRAKVAKANYKVSQVFPEKGVLASIFPENLASYFTKYTAESLGVDMNPGSHIESITSSPASGHKYQITLNNNKTIDTDHIVLSLGGTPNVQLAKRAVLEVDEISGGIVVNAELAARSDLYVAGDAASYFDGHLGRRRSDGIDHAETSGRYVGMNMMGNNYAYVYQPTRWGSIAKNISYQNVGIVDSRLDMVAVWQKGPNPELVAPPEASSGDLHAMPFLAPAQSDAPLSTEYYDAERYERGVVYYMDGKKVVGVSMINVQGQGDVAKRLITFPRDFEDMDSLTRQIYLGNKPKVEVEDDEL